MQADIKVTEAEVEAACRAVRMTPTEPNLHAMNLALGEFLASRAASPLPVAVFRGMRIAPAGTREFWGTIPIGVTPPDEGTELFSAPLDTSTTAAAPTDEWTFQEWFEYHKENAASRGPGDDWLSLMDSEKDNYEEAFQAGDRHARAALKGNAS